MNAIETKALTVAAHNRVAIESSPAESLAVFLKLKKLAVEFPEMRVHELDGVDGLDDAGNAGEDDDLLLSELVIAIEHAAQTLVEFGKSMLKAAHAGLVNAAIDGTLDSDANEWDLFSLADTNLNDSE